MTNLIFIKLLIKFIYALCDNKAYLIYSVENRHVVYKMLENVTLNSGKEFDFFSLIFLSNPSPSVFLNSVVGWLVDSASISEASVSLEGWGLLPGQP